MDIKFLIILITIGYSSALISPTGIRTPRAANSHDSSDDIQFDVADITTQLDYPGRTVTLEAFKVRNRTRSDAPKWVSIGYPMIVKDRNGQIFEFAPEYITVKIAVLDSLQKQTLFQMIKNQYPNENVRMENIIPLPLVQFVCGMHFYVNGTRYEFRGNVYNLRSSPFALRFPVHEGSSKRSALEKRLQSHYPLFLECELAATGKQEKINTLRISGEQIQRMDLADKLLGPADEKFVTRKQLQQLSQEILSSLHIETEYEIENDDFSEEFIYKILENSHARFEPLPIDEALAHLSMYGIKISDRDLAPDEIKRELSDVFHVSTEGNKSHIVAGRIKIRSSASSSGTSDGTRINTLRHNSSDTNQLNRNSERFSNSAGKTYGSLSSLNADRYSGNKGSILDMASSDIQYAMKKSDAWKRDTSTLDDQLQDINIHSQSGIKWELEGSRIVPKSLDVGRVTRMSLRQHLSFQRIQKRTTSEKYYRLYGLSTADSEIGSMSNDSLLRRIMELEEALKANISVVASAIDNKVNAAKSSMKSEIETKVSNAKTAVTSAFDTKITQINARMSTIESSLTSKMESKINNAKIAIIGEIDSKVSNAKSSITSQIDNVKTSLKAEIGNASAVTCVVKTTTTDSSYGGYRYSLNPVVTKSFSLKNFHCGSSGNYLNEISWQNWEYWNYENGQKGLHLSASYTCCNRQTGNCERRNSSQVVGYSGGDYIPIKDDGFAFRHLDCGSSEWYVNGIFWQSWDKVKIQEKDSWILNVKYRCCKRDP